MINKFAAVYSIVVGVSMTAMWIMFYVTGSIPELTTEPARILLHITAEIVTAVALIIAGSGLLAGKTWGYEVYLVATGALLYTMIQSPGYFLHFGQVGFVGMFIVLIILSVFLLTKMVKGSKSCSTGSQDDKN